MPALWHPLFLVIDTFEAELVWALFYFFYFPPEARLGAKLGLAMQREVQAAASLHRFVLIWEGARGVLASWLASDPRVCFSFSSIT